MAALTVGYEMVGHEVISLSSLRVVQSDVASFFPIVRALPLFSASEERALH